MPLSIRHTGRCSPLQRVLSVIVTHLIQPSSQSELIWCPYFVFTYLCYNELYVWSTIQCQGSESHWDICIQWYQSLDLGDYPRVSRKFILRYFVMMVAIWHTGRCSPSEFVLSQALKYQMLPSAGKERISHCIIFIPDSRCAKCWNYCRYIPKTLS